MSDIIVKTLEEIKRKGKLKRAGVVIRYLRMNYKLTLSRGALQKRINTLVQQNLTTNKHPPHTDINTLVAKAKNKQKRSLGKNKKEVLQNLH